MPVVALYGPPMRTSFIRAGPQDFHDSDGRLRQAALEGTLFRDAAATAWSPPFGSAPRPIGSLGIHGVELSGLRPPGSQQPGGNRTGNVLRVQGSRQQSRSCAPERRIENPTLLDALAHEFKTPLTSIKACQHGAAFPVTRCGPEQQRELLSIVDEEDGSF